MGQADPRVRFLAHGGGYAVGLTDTGMLRGAVSCDRQPGERDARVGGAGCGSLSFESAAGVGADAVGRFPRRSRGVRLTAGRHLPGRVNYLIGNDRRRWQRNVPTFAGASYQGVWPGIDATFTGSQHQLDYSFTVAPGADTGRIVLGYHGQSSLRLDHHGNLIVTAGSGRTVRQLAPTPIRRSAARSTRHAPDRPSRAARLRGRAGELDPGSAGRQLEAR